MNCCLQKYTTHQFTYFIYYLFQDNFKNAKIMKIRQFQKCKNYENPTNAKQFLLLLLYVNCFLWVTHLNLKQLEKHD